MEDLHRCENMPLTDIWYERNQDSIILNINRVATEQDLLENHYLEEVGQAVESIGVEVIFCPYCGKKLDTTNKFLAPSFTYHDFSKW